MQIVIALLIAGGAAWWIAFEEMKPAGPDDLKVEVGDLRSYASEAERIIEQAEAGKITQSFFQVEIELLRDKTQVASESIAAANLQSGPQPELAEKFAAARRLAEAGKDALFRLQPLFHQPQQMNTEKAKLEEVFQQAVALEKSLIQ